MGATTVSVDALLCQSLRPANVFNPRDHVG